MKSPDLVRYVLRGTAGDDAENDELDLGAEVVVVMRGQVSRIAERTNADSLVVRDTYIVATSAQVLDNVPAAIRKQLDARAADRLDGTDRLL